MGLQPIESSIEEALLPLPNRRRGGVELVGDVLIGVTVGQQQQNLSPQHEPGR